MEYTDFFKPDSTLGVEKCPATGGEIDQFRRPGEDLHEARPGHFWQVHRPAVANSGDILVAAVTDGISGSTRRG